MTVQMQTQKITSRDNPQVKAIKKLAQSNAGYKETGLVWLEGEHLCDAYLLSTSSQLIVAITISPLLALVFY